MTKVLLDTKEGRKRAPIEMEPAVVWTLVFGLGVVLAVVGWTDLGLLWYPLDLGNPEWEFGTISAHFNGMPLGTVGVALIAVGAVGRGWRMLARVIAVVAALIVFDLIAISVIYLLDVPVALRGTPPEVNSVLKRAMLKAGVFSATYTLFYAWLTWFLWKKAKLHKV